jgi:tagatose-6-phosphate ketose/aldose isomerase
LTLSFHFDSLQTLSFYRDLAFDVNQRRTRAKERLSAEPVSQTREVYARLQGSVDDWLAFVGSGSAEIARLLSASSDEQEQRGYRHTLREIAQQPLTWVETADGVPARLDAIRSALTRVVGNGHSGTIVFTGSGSSLYAGECLSSALQARLRIPVHAVAAGEVLTHPSGWLPPNGPCLLVSLARSGNSPESCGVLDSLRDTECRHLVITCNRHGRLATSYGDDARVTTVVLNDKTCDRSLVMTSSFTNMVLAGQVLGMAGDPDGYRTRGNELARLGADVLLRYADPLARVAREDYRSAVYLGSGCRYGSARESALKMLEMTAGEVTTFPETYLGLRHGPMAAVDERALVVCFLASDPVVRAYETDLVRELGRKKLGARKVIVGHDVPRDLAGPDDVVVDVPGGVAMADEAAPVLDVLVGQLLAFFRCLAIDLRPDMPSDDGVISRVVESFAIHRRS